MTSMRRSLTCSGRAMSRSRIRTFVETRPPALRHTLAAALSSAKPRRPSTPHVCARCVVVAKDVEWTATPAGTQSGGQREPEATKKEHPQHLGVEARVEGRWTIHEGADQPWVFFGTSTWPCPPSSWLLRIATHVSACVGLRLPRHLHRQRCQLGGWKPTSATLPSAWTKAER